MKHHGEMIVLENVAVEVCNVCGGTPVPWSTSEAIDAVLKNAGKPSRTAPVCESPETVPVIAGCAIQGETLAELMAIVREAVEGCRRDEEVCDV